MKEYPDWYTRDGRVQAKICRKGELVEITDSSAEKRLAGRCALDTYVARAVALDPDVTFGCIHYEDDEKAKKYINSLRSSVYHHGYPVFVGQRGHQLYIIKAVDFDG